MWHSYSGLSGGRYRRYLSLREGSEPPPGLVREEGVQMKGMYLGRRFYRQMFGAVLLTPIVMNTALLYPSLPGSFSKLFPFKGWF